MNLCSQKNYTNFLSSEVAFQLLAIVDFGDITLVMFNDVRIASWPEAVKEVCRYVFSSSVDGSTCYNTIQTCILLSLLGLNLFSAVSTKPYNEQIYLYSLWMGKEFVISNSAFQFQILITNMWKRNCLNMAGKCRDQLFVMSTDGGFIKGILRGVMCTKS